MVLQGHFVYEGLVTLLAGETRLSHILVHGHLVFLKTVQLVKPFLTARDVALKEKQIFLEVQT